MRTLEGKVVAREIKVGIVQPDLMNLLYQN